MIAIGVDVAHEGCDRSVATIRDNNRVLEIVTWSKEDIVQSADRVERLIHRYHPKQVIIDCDGLGVGCHDILKKKDYPVVAFHGSARTDNRDDTGELGFVNMRAYAWWNMRSLLEPSKGHGIILPADDDLIGDLCAPKWRIVSGSRIQVESKDDIKKRLKRSPDKGDSACYAFLNMEPSNYEDSFRVLNSEDVRQLTEGPRRPPTDDIPSFEIDPLDWEKQLWQGAHRNTSVWDY